MSAKISGTHSTHAAVLFSPERSSTTVSKKRRRRLALAEAQNWRCAYCSGVMALDGPGADLATIEHLNPRGSGRPRGRASCVAACFACNSSKADSSGYWGFRKLRRRLLQSGLWPACSYPSGEVAKLRRAGQCAALRSLTSAGSPFEVGAVDNHAA